MPIIVVEGMDNSGKTTLATKLAKDHHAIYIKAERPRRGIDLPIYLLMSRIAEEYGDGLVIMDRHLAISEPIYGTAIRGGHELSPIDLHSALRSIDLVIYCRPPKEVILKTLTDRPQMDGVDSQAEKILKMYDDFMNLNRSSGRLEIHWYDYTGDSYEKASQIITNAF